VARSRHCHQLAHSLVARCEVRVARLLNHSR
jgi:hypothetical protein